MLELFAWIVTALSIVGVVLNAQQKVSGFYFWMVANASWVIIDIHKGIYAQAVLFAFYFAMCFYGVYSWRKKAPTNAGA
jgi:nicotinamide riboside transporter PnuC